MSGTSAPRRGRKASQGAFPGLGGYVVDRRILLGLTQADLADLAGVGLSSVHALEAGRGGVSLSLAVRILDALGLGIAVSDWSRLDGAPGLVLRPDTELRP